MTSLVGARGSPMRSARLLLVVPSFGALSTVFGLMVLFDDAADVTVLRDGLL
jgi:hypothetical protein